jgi:hypothetical protein
VDDRALVAQQLGRQPRAFLRVVRRCPFGRPAVTEQSPVDSEGRPFPTTYYLTCRHVVAAVSRLEAAGGVERWTEAVAADRALADSLADGEAAQRRIRRGLAGDWEHSSLDLGIGGSRGGGSLKCLHAHAAFALAVPGYRLGEEILAELEPLWPGRCCTGQTTSIALVPIALDTARTEWEEGHRRVEAARPERPRYERLLAQVELVVDELRRRVGQSFTLGELASAYDDADRWAREVVSERAPSPGWPADLATIEAAAFYRYQRGALDYVP